MQKKPPKNINAMAATRLCDVFFSGFSVLYSRKINRALTETQVNRITANKIGTAKMALKRRSEENSLASRGPRFGKMSRSFEIVKAKEITGPTDEDLNFVIKVEKDNDF